MIERDQTSLPQTTLYDCGFPCQPFSLLNSSSQFMNAPEAECFRQSIRTIWACQPLIAVLENVMGLARKGVWRIVEKYLMKLTTYFFCRLHITPDKLGSCVSRRRIYILLLHRPVNSFSMFKIWVVCFGFVLSFVLFDFMSIWFCVCTFKLGPATLRSVLKDYIDSNEKLQKAAEIIYKQLQVFHRASPIFGRIFSMFVSIRVSQGFVSQGFFFKVLQYPLA